MEKDLLLIYADKFKENFPTYYIDVSDDELYAIVKKCIDENKPYKFEYDENLTY